MEINENRLVARVTNISLENWATRDKWKPFERIYIYHADYQGYQFSFHKLSGIIFLDVDGEVSSRFTYPEDTKDRQKLEHRSKLLRLYDSLYAYNKRKYGSEQEEEKRKSSANAEASQRERDAKIRRLNDLL